MENKAVDLLEKIKDGSILKELTEYGELKQLTESRKNMLDYTIKLNERCRFPRNKDVKKNFKFCVDHVPEIFKYLIDGGLVFNATIPEIAYVFGHNSRGMRMPKELYYATWNDISNFTSKGTSWNRRTESPRSTAYSRYHIALISKNQMPVFSRAFEFLDYLKPKPLIPNENQQLSTVRL